MGSQACVLRTGVAEDLATNRNEVCPALIDHNEETKKSGTLKDKKSGELLLLRRTRGLKNTAQALFGLTVLFNNGRCAVLISLIFRLLLR